MQTKSSKPNTLTNLIGWCQQNALLKFGAFFILLSLAWFLKYSFSNDFIGPMGQISIGLIAGTGFLLAGNLLYNKRANVATSFTIIGGLTILATAYSARNLYDLLTPFTAFGIMALAIVYMSFQAIKQNRKAIAIIALIGGGLIPILINSPSSNYLSLLIYVFLLNIASLIISSSKTWRSLSVISIFITAIYSLSFTEIYPEQQISVWILITLFYSQFLYNNISNIIKNKKIVLADIAIAGLNGILIINWIIYFTPEHFQNLIFCGIGLLGVALSNLLRQHTQFSNIYYIFLSLSLLYLGVATGQTFEGNTLLIAFAIESLTLVYLSYNRLKNYFLTKLSSIAFTIPVLMSLPALSPEIKNHMSNSEYSILLTIIITTGLASYIISKIKPAKLPYPLSSIILATIASTYFLRIIWLINASLITSYSLAKGLSLTIYTILGLTILFKGIQAKEKNNAVNILNRKTKTNSNKPGANKIQKAEILYRGGQIILGAVIIRLILVEAWQMTVVLRMTTFLTIGILFIATAFYNKKS